MIINNLKKEHILVCLSSSPSNPKVIKAASKMVNVFDADFTAVYIETSQSKKMSDENKSRLSDNTNLAKQNGAKIVTLNGDDIAYQVSQYAKKSDATKIIIGRSGYRPSRFFSPPNFVDKLIELTPEIEIFVIPDKAQKLYIEQPKTISLKLSLADILKSLLILLLATIAGEIFHHLGVGESNIILVYILGVFLIAYATQNKAYSLISSVFAVLLFNFFFTEPYFTLNINDSHYLITFAVMFVVTFFTSSITKKLKTQSEQVSLKAYSMEIMLDMSQKLLQAQNKNDIAQITIDQAQKLLDCDVELVSVEQKQTSNDIINWVFEKNLPADVDKIESKGVYFPIGNLDNVFAVIIIHENEISEFEKNLLVAMLRESALAYEKNEITEANNQLLIKNQHEEQRSTLLRAISHDLRTPLTSISGFADILMKNSQNLSEDKKQKIYADIYDDSAWLLSLIENILAITRFDQNKIKINKESEYISDVISDALLHLGRKKENHEITTDIEDEMLSAKIDAQLVSQVVFNLIDNAIKYTPQGTKIIVKVIAVADKIEVSVIDEGNGIAENDKSKIFDTFYTCQNTSIDGRRGLGLGLALCKVIIEAHGGEIFIKDNIPKGSIFSFLLERDNEDFYE